MPTARTGADPGSGTVSLNNVNAVGLAHFVSVPGIEAPGIAALQHEAVRSQAGRVGPGHPGMDVGVGHKQGNRLGHPPIRNRAV
jgi:hypothetical protein